MEEQRSHCELQEPATQAAHVPNRNNGRIVIQSRRSDHPKVLKGFLSFSGTLFAAADAQTAFGG